MAKRGVIGVICAGLLVALVGCDRGPSGEAPGSADAGSEVASVDAIEAILEAVQTAYRTGERDKAEGLLRAGVAEYEGDQDLRAAYATFLLESSEHAAAHEQFVRAVEIGPPTPELAMAAGTTASVIGETATAAEYFGVAVSLEPANVDYLLHLGQAQLELGEREAARATVTRATDLDDGRALAWALLAEISLREGDVVGALDLIAVARRIEPEELSWKSIEARAALAAGNCSLVLLLLDPLGVPARYEDGILGPLASCLEETGRLAEAEQLRAEAAAWHAPLEEERLDQEHDD